MNRVSSRRNSKRLWEAFQMDRFPQHRKEIFMKAMTANAVTDHPQRKGYLIPAILLVIMILAGFLAYRARQMPEPPAVAIISQSVMEEQYGLRVNLVAVTAAGGLVDVRLKIVDGEKARALLENPNNFPSLWISNGDVSLVVPEENRTQEIQFADNSNLFVMFPNGRGIVKPGTPVVIRFGATQIEPIPAK